MEERTERRTRPPLIHGRMFYRCERCGNSWPMYLEKGIEEFGENHKPSPFTITCPYCGGLAMDVSGIQKVPGGGYVPMPDGYGYFANVEGRDCGVPTFPPLPTVAEKAAADKEVLEDIQTRIKKYIDNFISAELMELAGEEIREIVEAACVLAERASCSTEEAMEAMGKAINGGFNPKRVRSGLDFKTTWERKEDRERRRAAERVNAARFYRQKARETGWRRQKRTRPRRREYRGPDIV